MDFNFKYYGNYPIGDILNKLSNLDWGEFTFRQKTYETHSNTLTVPLLWDDEKRSIKYWKDHEIFKDNLNEISNLLNEKIGKGFIETAILINLPKTKKIDSHYDAGMYFSERNRIHIPIITNNKCIFEVNGEEINMKQGEIWEINNSGKPHSVINGGEEDRIHLLIDWLTKKTKMI